MFSVTIRAEIKGGLTDEAKVLPCAYKGGIYYECQDKHFYAENYNNYLEKLNSNGLFGNYSDASSFICSIDSIINKVCLDCDGDLYPQYVYCLV